MTKDVLEKAKTGNPAWDTIIDSINKVDDICGEMAGTEEGCDINFLLIAENPKLGLIDYFRMENDDPNKLIGMLSNHSIIARQAKEILDGTDIKETDKKSLTDSHLLSRYLAYGVLNTILFDEDMRNFFFKRVREKQLIKGDWTVATQEEIREFAREHDNDEGGGKEE